VRNAYNLKTIRQSSHTQQHTQFKTVMKKSRKAKQFYSLLNRDGKEVSIDLNNYRVTCSKTGKRKSFYHKYLHNLIQSKYAGNIDTFRDTYVSREAGPSKNERKVQQIQDRIDRCFKQISNLKGELAEIETGNVCFPDA